MMHSRAFILLLLLCSLVTAARAEERFPPPEFRTAYQLPLEQQPATRAAYFQYIDVAALAIALLLAWLIVHRWRSRTGVFLLTLACLAYFGFYRQGCVCAVGSIQNVIAALAGDYALPWSVALFFGLPLAAALLVGRIFCAGVCPLGAIQDLVLFKPIQVPRWLESALGLFAHLYLALAVLFAATATDFIICAYDPFVGLFRFSGTLGMLVLGVALLVLSMFVGRAYCRFFCPYAILLRITSRLAWRKVHISPKTCIDCKLCEKSCPFSAIETPQRPTLTRSQSRRRLYLAIGTSTALLLLLPTFGWLSSPVLARHDRTVQLAQRIAAEDAGTLTLRTDDSTAWRKSGETSTALFTRAAAIEHRLTIGSALIGLYMSLIIGHRLLRTSLPQRIDLYDADPAGCLACARCFETCPVEWQRRGLDMPVPLTVKLNAPAPAEAAP